MAKFILILLVSLPWASPTSGSQSQNKPKTSKSKQETVYITRTGKRYHRTGCRYLHSKIKTNIVEASKAGYTPCKVCKPGGYNKKPSDFGKSGKVTSGRCQATTKKGTRCKRSASSGSYCWQHP